MFQDIEIICADCKHTFVYSQGEQEFAADKQAETGQVWQMPKRCKECRRKKAIERENAEKTSRQ